MPPVRRCEVPTNTFLRAYRDNGSFADCYVTEVSGRVSKPAYVEAFYTTALFKVERALLEWFARFPSTDDEARLFASGEANSFAAWRVESRDAQQLLVAAGRTRSWFMVAPAGSDGTGGTRLYFGSAIVARPGARTGKPELGFLFHALLGFHKLYSRALLFCARNRVVNCDHRDT